MTETQKEIISSEEEIKHLRRSLEFYKCRMEMLQCWQSSMRDPERKIVCDILANGFTLTTKEEIDKVKQCVYWGYKEGKTVCSLLIPDPSLYVELTDAIKIEAVSKSHVDLLTRLTALCTEAEGIPCVMWADIECLFAKLGSEGP